MRFPCQSHPLGARLEHDYYNGFAAMPSGSVVWTPNDHQTLWGSISRAVQTPSALDASVRFNIDVASGPGGIPTVLSLFGNPQILNENLLAYQTGYRTTVSDRLSVDVAAYYNSYTDLHTEEPVTPFLEGSPSPTHLVEPYTYENMMFGEMQGLKFSPIGRHRPGGR